MGRVMLLLCVAAVVGSSVASSYNSYCSWTPSKSPFDPEKFAGDWHLIAGTPRLARNLPHCSKFQYAKQGDGGAVFTYSWKNDKGEKIEIVNKGKAYHSDEPSSMVSAYKSPTGKWTGMYDLNIAASDYDNFAIIIMCRDVFDDKTETFGREKMASILSRKPLMSEETIKVLKGVISGYDMDPAQLQIADNTNCV